MSEESPPEEGGRLRTLRRSSRRRISLIWAIPLVAVLLGASLVLQTYLAKGPTIEITFPAAAGIKAGATPIKHLDVEVGVVTEVRLNESLDGVVATAELQPNAASYLRQGTVFWLVQPRVSLAGISGIETLLSGQYIDVVPSLEGASQTVFEGKMNPPIGARYPRGKSVVLETDRLGSIAQGTPVYHRGLPAGEVEHYELAESDERIRVYVMIDETFASRVREGSVFWNASGIDARVGLDGFEVRTQGLAAVLASGVAFSSPDEAPEAASGATFLLHDGPDAAQEARSRADGLAVWLESRDGRGLGPGTPVYYRGLEVGSLGNSQLTGDARAVRIEAFVEQRFRPLVREGTRFFKSSGVDFSLGLDGLRVRTESLRAVALGGVSIAVPEGASAAAADGALFALYEEPQDDWLAWEPEVALDGETTAVEHQLPPDPHAGALELGLTADELGGVGIGSPVLYRSVPVGEVIEQSLHRDGGSVEIRVRIDAAHRRHVGSRTRFFRYPGLSLDVGFGGVDLEVGSLKTLALGGIAFATPADGGREARSSDRFVLYPDEDEALADLREADFLSVVVEAPESMLREGAPVYFRRHQVGEVGDPTLTADGQAVHVPLRIERRYATLVRANTRFWSPDAVSIEASLAGVEIEAAPMQALLAGGVMLATPTEASGEAQGGAVFRLESRAPSGWDTWTPAFSLAAGDASRYAVDAREPEGLQMMLAATQADSIGEGDPIFYRGLQIGSVGASRLAVDGTEVLLDVLIAPEFTAVIRSNTQFWNASGLDIEIGWDGVEARTGPLDTIVRGGIQVATPEPAGARASAGDRFELRAEPDEGWQSWSPVLR